MSIWSSIGKIFSGGAKVVSSLDPTGTLGKVAGAVTAPIDSMVQRQENKEDWRRQTSWQEKMTMQNQQYNSAEAEKARQFNASEAEKARQFNASEAEKAHQRNIDLFNMENEYNSPRSQLERMRQAGMNPALMNGGSLVSASASPTPVASGSPASGSAASGSAPSSPVLQNPLSAAQYRLLNEQATAQNLANREKANDIKAKENLKDSPFDLFSTQTNEDGTKEYIVVKSPKTNYWDELRDKHRLETFNQSLSNDEKQLSYDILNATKDFVIKGKENELQQMIRKLALLKNEQEVSDIKTNLLKKYGIQADAPWLNNIISMILSSPNNASNVLNSVYATIYNFLLNNMRNQKNLPSTFINFLKDAYNIWTE